jgi:hypothetical protein
VDHPAVLAPYVGGAAAGAFGYASAGALAAGLSAGVGLAGAMATNQDTRRDDTVHHNHAHARGGQPNRGLRHDAGLPAAETAPTASGAAAAASTFIGCGISSRMAWKFEYHLNASPPDAGSISSK